MLGFCGRDFSERDTAWRNRLVHWLVGFHWCDGRQLEWESWHRGARGAVGVWLAHAIAARGSIVPVVFLRLNL
ncbi:hypothetical protein VTJ04DRAFT_6742 [Mycothermus thermophilus]|uniref:uncharacterized protein n=1 Tax=Humicola insolens TaxID=85995 RepID=UPI0037430D8F